MFERFTRPRPHDAAKTDHFAMADTDGMAAVAAIVTRGQEDRASWCGGMTVEQANAAARDGWKEGVSASDAMLAKFDDLSFETRRWKTIDTVCGGAPNVGAFLAGSPVAMRRRERTASELAPLTVFCDVVASAGIKAQDMQKRGVALLALVRALGAVRPVTVYAVGGGQASDDGDAFALVKIDVATLDLSRSAFFLGHPAYPRALLYTACAVSNGIRLKAKGERGILHWAWSDHKAYLMHGHAMWAAAAGVPVEESIWLAPPHLSDPAIKDPVAWVKDMLAQHGMPTPA